MKVGFLLAGLFLSAMVFWLLHESGARSAWEATTPPGAVAAARTVDSAGRTSERIVSPPPALAVIASSDHAPPPGDAELSSDDQRAHLQAWFAGERTDTAWAVASQRALHDDFERFASADARPRDIECRSSLCRIVLTLSSPEAGSRFMESWLHERSWTGPGFVATQDTSPGGDPRSSMIVFLGRPGTELPYAQ